jgi:hypothetical protein
MDHKDQKKHSFFGQFYKSDEKYDRDWSQQIKPQNKVIQLVSHHNFEGKNGLHL